MTIEQIREMHAARPFQPFDIFLADGRRFRVELPEFLMQSHSGRTITVSLAEDRTAVIDLLLVTSLEQLANGRRRRPRGAPCPAGGGRYSSCEHLTSDRWQDGFGQRSLRCDGAPRR